MHRRFPFFVLILIVLVGLLMFGGQSRQQEAWTQGYLTGLAAGGQSGAAIPYALAMQNQRSGPGFFGMLVGLGLLAMLFMVTMRAFRHAAGRAAEGSAGEDWMRHWQRYGPWRGCGSERSEARAAPEDPPVRQPMPAEPVETMQPTTTG